MDTSTGALASFEREEDAKRAGFNRLLTQEECGEVFPMNRAQRRKWAREQAKKTKSLNHGGGQKKTRIHQGLW